MNLLKDYILHQLRRFLSQIFKKMIGTDLPNLGLIRIPNRRFPYQFSSNPHLHTQHIIMIEFFYVLNVIILLITNNTNKFMITAFS